MAAGTGFGGGHGDAARGCAGLNWGPSAVACEVLSLLLRPAPELLIPEPDRGVSHRKQSVGPTQAVTLKHSRCRQRKPGSP